MLFETKRLIVTELTMDMVSDIQKNSIDEDNIRFVPDEVFETIEDAKEVVEYLIAQYEDKEGPLLYALITKEGNKNIGYVQIVPLDDGKAWEVGYHIAKDYTKKGYATEAVKDFLPKACEMLNINEVKGICLKENSGSIRVLEKCGFTKVFEGIDDYQGENREIIECVWKKM